jgi:hypothetical protein
VHFDLGQLLVAGLLALLRQDVPDGLLRRTPQWLACIALTAGLGLYGWARFPEALWAPEQREAGLALVWAVLYLSAPVVVAALLPPLPTVRLQKAGLALALFSACQLTVGSEVLCRCLNVVIGRAMWNPNWNLGDLGSQLAWTALASALLGVLAVVIALRSPRRLGAV